MNAPQYFRPFDWTDGTFKNRVPQPRPLDAALGIITMSFSELEYVIDRVIAYLAELRRDEPTADLTELSFKRKVDLLASGFSELNSGCAPFADRADRKEVIRQLMCNLRQAGELYHQIMSTICGYEGRSRAVDQLFPKCPTNGPKVRPGGALTADRLLDIGDFIGVAEWDLDELFREFQEVRQIGAH